MPVNPSEIRTFCTELYTRAAEVAKTKQSGNIRAGDILIAVEQLKKEKGSQYAGKVGEFLNRNYQNNETGELKSLAELYESASKKLTEKDKGEKNPLAKLGAVLTKVTDTTEQLDRSTRTSIRLAQLQFSGKGDFLSNLKVMVRELFRSLSRIGGLPQEQKIVLNNKIAQFEKLLTQELPMVSAGGKTASELSEWLQKGMKIFKNDVLKLSDVPKGVRTKIEAEVNGFASEVDALLKPELLPILSSDRRQIDQEAQFMTRPKSRLGRRSEVSSIDQSGRSERKIGSNPGLKTVTEKKTEEEATKPKPKGQASKAEPRQLPETPKRKPVASTSLSEEDKKQQAEGIALIKAMIQSLNKVKNTQVHIEQRTREKLEKEFPTLSFEGDAPHLQFDLKSLLGCILERVEAGDLKTTKTCEDILNVDKLAEQDMERIEDESTGAATLAPLSEKDKATPEEAIKVFKQMIQDLSKISDTRVHTQPATCAKLKSMFPELTVRGDKKHPEFDMKSLLQSTVENLERGDLKKVKSLGIIFSADPLAMRDLDRIQKEVEKLGEP